MKGPPWQPQMGQLLLPHWKDVKLFLIFAKDRQKHSLSWLIASVPSETVWLLLLGLAVLSGSNRSAALF